MSVEGSKKYYLAWANLVDFAIESLSKNLIQKYEPAKASRELKKTLRHQSDQHWEDMCCLLKKIK